MRILVKSFFIDSFPRPTMERINEYTHANNLCLPDVYVQFLQKNNGTFFNGHTSLYISNNIEVAVFYLFALDTMFDYADLQSNLDLYKDMYGENGNFMPIAIDPYGNFYCMRTSQNDKHDIWLLDHETGQLEIPLAPGFELFIKNLYSNYHTWSESGRLCQLIERGQVDALKKLLDSGHFDFSERNRFSWDLLTFAAHCDHPLICEMLLDAGMDVNGSNEDGTSPLKVTSSVDVLKILTEHGANMEIKSADGRTPLLYYVKNYKQRMAMELIKKGADLSAVDNEGRDVMSYINEYNPYVKSFMENKYGK